MLMLVLIQVVNRKRWRQDKNSHHYFHSRTPLMHAVTWDHYEAAQLLLKHGADVMMIDDENRNVFDYATQGTR